MAHILRDYSDRQDWVKLDKYKDNSFTKSILNWKKITEVIQAKFIHDLFRSKI